MHPPVKTLIDLPRMGLIARGMLATAFEAFVAQSVALAEDVIFIVEARDVRHAFSTRKP
jgi:phosphate uptake regulator